MSITFEGQVDVDEHRAEYMKGLINLKSNGLFTVSHPEMGRRTFRIKTETWNRGQDDEEQKRVIAYLSGPANTGDYTSIGFVKTSSNDAEIKPWQRFIYTEIVDWAHILIRFAMGQQPEDWSLHAATRCRRCGRLLTVPQSVASGIGPVCVGR